jgi:hypothetical protein
VDLDSVPPPLTLQETPAAFLSFKTVAANVTESVASTVLADAVTETLTGVELPLPPPPPPQPDRHNAETSAIVNKNSFFPDIEVSLRKTA